MSGFTNKALALWLLSAGVAWAAPAAAPHDTGPAFEDNESETQEAPAQPPIDTAAAPKETISETNINAPSIDGFGIQDKDGLSADIWKGSTRETIDPLIAELHAGVSEPSLASLLTRLLMSQAVPPEGTTPGHSWFVLRVDALIATGQEEKAEQLISSLPASMMQPGLRRTQLELTLIRGRYDKACEEVQPDALPADDSGEGFWQKLAIFCKAQQGKHDEALLGIDLLREEQHDDDAFFQEVIRRIGDKNALVKSNPKRWSLFNVALLRRSGDTDKIREKMDAFPPVAVRYIAQDTSLDIKLREKATSRGQQLGIVAEGSKTPEQPFSRSLASDVTTLVAALGAGKPVNESDNAVIARLALGDAGIGDSRRVMRLLTLMEPFGYRVPPAIWHSLLEHPERYDGETPPATWVARLNDAAQAGKRGEVVVLSALVTTGTDISRMSDLALLPVIQALLHAGFDKEARAVAYAAVKNYSGR